MKKTIYFAHANGFPGPCYQAFFAGLKEAATLYYTDKLGHHPDYPLIDNWHGLVNELIHHIENTADVPVIGVGHSLGGVLHFIASYQRPDLYQAVVMLDSPVLRPMISTLIRLLKLSGHIEKITPAGKTKYRKTTWANAEEALLYLKERPLFAHFDTACLNDYITHGMVKDEQGIHLRFNREIEYRIYCTLPHNLARYQHRRSVPTGVLYGEDSHVIKTKDVAYLSTRLGMKVKATPGGHLFPFEYPRQAAKMTLEMIDALL